MSKTSSPEAAPRRRDERYYAARLAVPPELEDAAVAAFWEAGCLGVEVISSTRNLKRPRLTLCAYFPGRAARRPLETRLGRELGKAGLGPPRRPRFSVVRDRRWVEVWQRTLKPMRIGRRLLIVPRGCRPGPAGGRLEIGVRFGQAFGTGEHPSTRMSLRLLESHLRPGDRVVDLGTGTGILAMAARRLGAGPVLAVDSDPVALRVARANLSDNRLLRGVTLRRDDAGTACAPGPFDLAMVNIGATSIARILPGLARALAPGGCAILAGILIDDEAALLDQAGRLGLEFAGRLRTRPWSALLLVRPARGGLIRSKPVLYTATRDQAGSSITGKTSRAPRGHGWPSPRPR